MEECGAGVGGNAGAGPGDGVGLMVLRRRAGLWTGLSPPPGPSTPSTVTPLPAPGLLLAEGDRVDGLREGAAPLPPAAVTRPRLSDPRRWVGANSCRVEGLPLGGTGLRGSTTPRVPPGLAPPLPLPPWTEYWPGSTLHIAPTPEKSPPRCEGAAWRTTLAPPP
jgi:hypothetical protein